MPARPLRQACLLGFPSRQRDLVLAKLLLVFQLRGFRLLGFPRKTRLFLLFPRQACLFGSLCFLGFLCKPGLLRLLRDETLLLGTELVGQPPAFGFGLGALRLGDRLGTQGCEPSLDHRCHIVRRHFDQFRRCGKYLGARRRRWIEA